MLSIIGFIVVLCVGIWALGALPSSIIFESRKNLNESAIVKRFNKVLGSLKERNLDQVKQELIECLDQYSTVKEKQFTFTLSQIRASKAEIKDQRNKMEESLHYAEVGLRKFKDLHKGETSEEVINKGANLLYKYKTSEVILNKLIESENTLKTRESDLLSMLSDFNSNLAVKKAEIAIMVADSTGIFSGSTIDLRLDNLVKEFQGKVIEGQAAQDVHDKMHSEERASYNVNYAACVEEFKKELLD